MKKNLFRFLFFLLICGEFRNDVLALREAVVDRYSYTLQQQAESTINLGTYGMQFYGLNSTVYEFFDTNHLYNIVYTLKEDTTKLGWITLSSDLKSIKTERYIDAKLEMFGNAIYKDGYLYVVYGANDTKTLDSTKSDFATSITLEVVKYNSNGNIVADLPIAGKETSRMTKTDSSLDSIKYGTVRPFDSGNCAIAINSSGVMRVLFNKEMYNGHTMSYNLFIDTKNFTYLNRPSTIDTGNRYYNYIGVTSTGFWISHSFEERIIATSDGNFLSIDQGDAYPRSMVLVKGYTNSNGVEDLSKYNVFRFREGADSSYGYNNTFASTGNLIELSDGYLFVATSEKTLSLNYAPHSTFNESRNIFIQKYTKDLKGKTVQGIQLFNTAARTSESERTSTKNQGSFYLSSKQISDYGVKWLTDYQNDYNISEVRASKISDTRVIITWAERAMKVYGSGYMHTGDTRYYYMIIDNNGNTVVSKTAVNKSTPTNLIDYVYKDGYLYFSESDGQGHITLNKLNVNKTEEEAVLTSTTPDSITITDSDITTYQLNVTTNKNTGITWKSSNSSIAIVDENGKVTILKNGTVKITATLNDYSISKEFQLTVDYKLKEIQLSYDVKEVGLDDYEYLSLKYLPTNAYNKTVNWEVEDEDIISLAYSSTRGGSNKVTGKKVGSTKIILTTADGSNIRIEIPIKVVSLYTSLTNNETYKYLNKGEKYKINYTTTPTIATESITFRSTNENVVTVDENGVVTAVGTGNAYIYTETTASRISSRTTINVKNNLTGVKLKYTSIFLPKGNRVKLEYETIPIDAENVSGIQYQTSNVSVADIDNNGNIIAKGNGTATITITINNRYTASCTVTVGDYIKGDMNKSGKIDLTDILLLIKLYFNKIESTDYYETVGNMNNNDGIDLTDILLLIKSYFGKN